MQIEFSLLISCFHDLIYVIITKLWSVVRSAPEKLRELLDVVSEFCIYLLDFSRYFFFSWIAENKCWLLPTGSTYKTQVVILSYFFSTHIFRSNYHFLPLLQRRSNLPIPLDVHLTLCLFYKLFNLLIHLFYLVVITVCCWNLPSDNNLFPGFTTFSNFISLYPWSCSMLTTLLAISWSVIIANLCSMFLKKHSICFWYQ